MVEISNHKKVIYIFQYTNFQNGQIILKHSNLNIPNSTILCTIQNFHQQINY